jgi:hypothetical protein
MTIFTSDAPQPLRRRRAALAARRHLLSFSAKRAFDDDAPILTVKQRVEPTDSLPRWSIRS